MWKTIKKLFKLTVGALAGPIADSPAKQPDLHTYTPRARQVLVLAHKEAERLNHNFVGTEHLVIGLIALGQGVALIFLGKLGVTLEAARTEVEAIVGKGPDEKWPHEIPYTPRIKKVFVLAAEHARALNHTYVGTEHLLLGTLQEGNGVGARVLKKLGVNIEETRKEILRELDPNSGAE